MARTCSAAAQGVTNPYGLSAAHGAPSLRDGPPVWRERTYGWPMSFLNLARHETDAITGAEARLDISASLLRDRATIASRMLSTVVVNASLTRWSRSRRSFTGCVRLAPSVTSIAVIATSGPAFSTTFSIGPSVGA
jgi:hypothetical protein